MADRGGRVAKSEMAYQAVRARIITGDYGVGERLVLDQIARDLNVSPVPVREALRRLEAERLVTFTRNIGAEVAAVVDPYSEVMETLAYLEGAATALAAPHLGDDQLDEAEAINDELGRLAVEGVDAGRFVDLNQQFHSTLWSACPNRYLLALVQREMERVQFIRANELVFAPDNAPVSVEEHAEILRLIREGADAVGIEQAARLHKLRSRQAFVMVDLA
ncbi:MAG: GntR family transcriptional regulator [Propionibacterium sp.]|nr:GntR family transcriptional regulator [Propionibacterium sp.]